MKELHAEGLATHSDPESCVGVRKGVGEALTGARAGRVLSREKSLRDADTVIIAGRQHVGGRQRKSSDGPARSETPRMHGTSMHENREIPWLSNGNKWIVSERPKL